MAHNKIIEVAPRGHFKSTRNYSEIAREIFTTRDDIQARYFSFNSSMANLHVRNIKEALLTDNIYFKGLTDNNTTAKFLLDFTNSVGGRYRLYPHGVNNFTRGIHSERIYLDDIFGDESNKLDPQQIYNINRAVRERIMPMLKRGGKMRIVGTPQTQEDIYFDDNFAKQFVITFSDAIVNEKKKQVLWEEAMGWDELMQRKSLMMTREFNQEYRCIPAYDADAYLDREQVLSCVKTGLKDPKGYNGKDEIVAGFDIGKKAHPSHLVIFQKTNDDKYIQLHSQWFDKVEYSTQLEELKRVIEEYKVDMLRYDNTRAEFESFAERGELPRCMNPVNFNLKTKHLMAAALGRVVEHSKIEFLNDQRQVNQMLAVTNDLKAASSAEGHGDSFWSIALAVSDDARLPYIVDDKGNRTLAMAL